MAVNVETVGIRPPDRPNIKHIAAPRPLPRLLDRCRRDISKLAKPVHKCHDIKLAVSCGGHKLIMQFVRVRERFGEGTLLGHKNDRLMVQESIKKSAIDRWDSGRRSDDGFGEPGFETLYNKFLLPFRPNKVDDLPGWRQKTEKFTERKDFGHRVGEANKPARAGRDKLFGQLLERPVDQRVT